MNPTRQGTRRRALARAATALTMAVALPATAWAVGSVSTVSPRPMGMGGAFMAVEDEIAAMAWNPGAFAPPLCRRGGFRFHANVLGAPAIARETGLLTGVETDEFAGLPAAERMSIAVGGILKSVTFRRRGFACGVLFLEEHLDPYGLAESKGLADAGHLLGAYYSSFCVVFRLDPRVSIGLSETIFAHLDDDGERRFGIGRSYGAVLRPNDDVTVGLAYFDLPPEFTEERREIEGIAPRTMNAGLAYRPIENLVLSFDLRDLAEKHAGTAFQPRGGLEWNLWGKAALRAGAYREEGGNGDVLTAGLGAIPMPGCGGGDGVRSSDAFVLNYAVLLSARTGPRHLLSVVLHL